MMPRLAAIGECMLELSRNRNQVEKKYTLGYGGDSLNTALYFARWGGEVEYVTAIGDDPYSEAMLEDWKSENIGISLVQKIPNRQSGLYMVETDDKGERSFHYWRDNAPAREIFKLENTHHLLKKLVSFEYIYFSGITLSLYSEQSLDVFYDFLVNYKNNNGQIIFDLNYRPARWKNVEQAKKTFERFIPLVDIALPSFDDEKLLEAGSTPEKIINKYQDLNIKEIVLKCGDEGCILHFGKSAKKISTEIISNPVDTTAAGDAFNGGYLAAKLSGKGLEEAVKQGQKCASLVIQYPGAIVPRNEWPKDYNLN